MPRDVRTHTRRAASGKTTTVNHHTRRGSSAGPQKPKRKRGPNPGHAWKLTRKARAHGHHGRNGKAALIGALALAEVGAWLTLSGTSFVLALAAGILVAISVLLVR
jgi:hypothetical protein